MLPSSTSSTLPVIKNRRMIDHATHTMSLDELPTDLLTKILNLLSTSERARLSIICHHLHDLIKASWTTITLHCSSTAELLNQTQWLKSIADCRLQTLQSLQWQPRPTNTAPAISESLPLGCFTALRVLDLRHQWLPSPSPWEEPRCRLKLLGSSLQGVAELRHLEELYIGFRTASIADGIFAELSDLPELRVLDVMIDENHLWDGTGQGLTLSERKEGFPSLQSLNLGWAASIVENAAWQRIVKQLRSLRLTIINSLLQVVDAPNLTSLTYEEACEPERPQMPFSTSDQLSILAWRQIGSEIHATATRLDFSQASFASVSRLDLQEAPIAYTEQVIHQLASFQRLTDLRLGCYQSLDPDYELRPLTSLVSLERLRISRWKASSRSLRLLAAEDCMAKMTSLELKLSAGIFLRKLQRGLCLEAWFPALKVLRCTMRRIAGVTESLTLQELDLSDYGLAREGVAVTLGNLPRLEILRLHVRLLVKEDIDRFLTVLAALHNLRELELRRAQVPKDHSQSWEGNYLRDRFSESDFVSGIFRVLSARVRPSRQHYHLDVLKLVDCNLKRCVTLDREALPCVKHLGIACQQLTVGPTCMPWQETTLDLQFEQADATTLRLLTATLQLTTSDLPAAKLRRFVKLDNKDNNPSDFPARLTPLSVPKWLADL